MVQLVLPAVAVQRAINCLELAAGRVRPTDPAMAGIIMMEVQKMRAQLLTQIGATQEVS